MEGLTRDRPFSQQRRDDRVLARTGTKNKYSHLLRVSNPVERVSLD